MLRELALGVEEERDHYAYGQLGVDARHPWAILLLAEVTEPVPARPAAVPTARARVVRGGVQH